MSRKKNLAQMHSEVSEVIGPASDIANAAFKLLIQRCDDLELSPMVAIMFLREMCELNARCMIDDKQKAIDHFISHIPGLKDHVNPENIDMFELLEETIAKVVKGGMKQIKVEDM